MTDKPDMLRAFRVVRYRDGFMLERRMLPFLYWPTSYHWSLDEAVKRAWTHATDGQRVA